MQFSFPMPLTFIDIERQKSWRIAVFFAVLLLLYCIVFAAIGAAFFPFLWSAPLRAWCFLGSLAGLVAGLHLWFAASDAVDTVVRTLDAQPPDAEDRIHTVLLNVMEELHVVTGNKRRIRCAVIPTLSLNALAVADLHGNALIAITEGLLSRLTRSQMEAVLAHEAHHILSGDCLESTVAASIFGTLSSGVERFRATTQNRGFTLPAFLFAWLLLQLAYLLNLFISREREYRADAAAVRMCRNPIALAEVLSLLSRSWRGAGFIGSGLEMLCIVNPQATALDESEGILADLLSTHPPLKKRMEIMLAMARVSIQELERRAIKKAPVPAADQAVYFALTPQQAWEGPFTLAELTGLSWLGPLTWVATGQQSKADRAWKFPAINDLFLARVAMPERSPAFALSSLLCPVCRQPLLDRDYEGTRNYHCASCGGTLALSVHVPRIIARTANHSPCTERINALARAVLSANQARSLRHVHAPAALATAPHLVCPQCNHPMLRGFYSMTYLVEIDRCHNCGLTWFDRDELEMLQCMIANRLTSGKEPGSLGVDRGGSA